MIDEMLKYLNLAESMSSNISLFQMSDLYNIVLDSLLKDGQVCLALSHTLTHTHTHTHTRLRTPKVHANWAE